MQKDQLIEKFKYIGFSNVVIEAFKRIPRQKFLPENLKQQAYQDRALPIGYEQTISQPYTIATMLDLLDVKKGQKVLEIGSGCGYVLALISQIVGENGKVFGVEILSELVEKAKENVKDFDRIEIYNRNGVDGLTEEQPFDRILISAACEKIPENLIKQLKNKGIIVAPIGPSNHQHLTKLEKFENHLEIREKIPGFIFVPFIQS